MSGGGFSADWLQRREPFDLAARAAAAARLRLPHWLAARCPPQGPWRVIDLGCGTGASLRALGPLLPGAQQWLLVDHDPALLARVHGGGPGVEWCTRSLDLARELESLPFDTASLVTTSALLDLVGTDWLRRLVDACTRARAAVVWSLSVDGRQVWDPVDPDDESVRLLFNRHQRRDKGFGPAQGPRAGAVAARALRAAGYRVGVARSDWLLDGGADTAAQELQRMLIDGIADAACEQAPTCVSDIRAWQSRRQMLAAHSRLRIGHVDLVGAPA